LLASVKNGQLGHGAILPPRGRNRSYFVNATSCRISRSYCRMSEEAQTQMKKSLLTAVFSLALALGTAQAQVVVRIGPPPPPLRQVVPVAPGARYVWVPGYYRYNGHAYVWVPGRYAIPPYHYRVWVPGRWVPRNGGYVWVAGSWK
jgi:hypothetical protein